LQKPEFIWLLSDIEWRVGSEKNAIEKFIPKINKLMLHIEGEINQ
jgi:hypothetical protein